MLFSYLPHSALFVMSPIHGMGTNGSTHSLFSQLSKASLTERTRSWVKTALCQLFISFLLIASVVFLCLGSTASLQWNAWLRTKFSPFLHVQLCTLTVTNQPLPLTYSLDLLSFTGLFLPLASIIIYWAFSSFSLWAFAFGFFLFL